MVKRSFYFFIDEKVGEEFTRLARESVGVGVAAEEAIRAKIAEMKGETHTQTLPDLANSKQTQQTNTETEEEEPEGEWA